MKKTVLTFLLAFGLALFAFSTAHADQTAKLMVLDFQLDDRTDLPNAPEELERIAFLSSSFKQKLTDAGVALVPVNDRLKKELITQSPTYLFDRVEYAATLAEGSGADYLLIAVALKPTYLFVYPRILLVDVNTRQVAMAKAAQLESSWSDKNTTSRTGEKLAEMVSARLLELSGKAN